MNNNIPILEPPPHNTNLQPHKPIKYNKSYHKRKQPCFEKSGLTYIPECIFIQI